MKKLYITLLLGLFLISLTSAEDISNIGNFKQNDAINLYQVCDNCTYVNLTSVKYPDSLIDLLNVEMSKNGNDYIYNFTNTGKIGNYKYTVCGDKNGVFKCEVLSFDITPSGFSNSLGFYILILILSVGIIILGFWKNDAPIVILGSFGLYFIGLYIMFFGIDGLKDTVYTYAISLIILSLASYISIRSSYELIVD